MKSFFIICFILVSTVSFAQSSVALEDSVEIQAFEDYVHSILEREKDSILPKAPIVGYKVKYMTSCHFTETLYSDEALYSTSGKSFRSSELGQDTNSTDLFEGNFSNNDQPYLCGENPTKPEYESIIYIHLDKAEIDENGIITGMYTSHDPDSKTTQHFFVEGHIGYSFNGSEFMIMESSGIYSIGSQTSHGSTATMYLEGLEE